MNCCKQFFNGANTEFKPRVACCYCHKSAATLIKLKYPAAVEAVGQR